MRRVTAVKPGVYRARASIPGVKVSVSPSILSFNAAGQTWMFRDTFTNKTAEFDEAGLWLPHLEGGRHLGPYLPWR